MKRDLFNICLLESGIQLLFFSRIHVDGIGLSNMK